MGADHLRLDDEALVEFRTWRAELEQRLRGSSLHPAMESHLAKYRGLGPKLALICHLCSGGVGPVSGDAMARALGWLEYLESHAKRAYGSVLAAAATDARILVEKIRRGALPARFTERDVYRKEWRGLTDPARVHAALDVLVEHDWLGREQVQTGGRPTHVFTVNPKGLTA
jgi:putative DNA primase/helicase